MSRKKLLICGGTGFIGRNLVRHFLANNQYEVCALYHNKMPPRDLGRSGKIKWIKADLTSPNDVRSAVSGHDVVVQAAATTSGAKDIVSKPYVHVTDNAVMNALLLRACFEEKIQHFVFLSCTTMYSPKARPVKEDDFNGEMVDAYFGGGWTKVYNEKMCEFYSRIGSTKHTVIRHSNVYGPFDKFDLEKSHVFGATVTKIMEARENKIVVWGDGSDERDLLYVDDLLSFIELILEKQKKPFELLNLGSGETYSVRTLVERLIHHSGKTLKIEYDTTKPSIGFKLKLNIDQALQYGWEPKVFLDEGIQKTLRWYSKNQLAVAASS